MPKQIYPLQEYNTTAGNRPPVARCGQKRRTEKDRPDRADRQGTCIRTTSYCQLESYLFTDCLPFSRVDNDDDDGGDELRRRRRLRPRCAGCQIALPECAEVRVVRGSFPIGGVTRLPQLCLALLASYLPLFSHRVGEFDMQVGSRSGCHLLSIGGVVQTNNCS